MKKDSTQKVILNLKCEELGINIDVEYDYSTIFFLNYKI